MDLGSLVPLLAEAADAKRLRVAGVPASLAERAFLGAWALLVDGVDARRVALGVTARAVAGAKLAGIDAAALADAGLAPAEAVEVLQRGFDAAAGTALPDPLRSELRAALADPLPAPATSPPAFALALCRQPRAGATRPGHPRLVLSPAESHGDHCWAVAVDAVLCTPRFGADVARVFLAGLAHHLHNARWPDAGDAGDQLVGDRLPGIQARLSAAALAELPARLRADVEDARTLVPASDSPDALAFQAADVLDRVLEQRQYARVAAFTLGHALDDLELVHAGPLQRLHLDLLDEAGLR